eukprot:scaffold382_cov415-Chaetoceros_neogracile.AAC.19
MVVWTSSGIQLTISNPSINEILRKILLIDIEQADFYLAVVLVALICLCFKQIHAQRKVLPRRPALQILFKPDDVSTAQKQNDNAVNHEFDLNDEDMSIDPSIPNVIVRNVRNKKHQKESPVQQLTTHSPSTSTVLHCNREILTFAHNIPTTSPPTSTVLHCNREILTFAQLQIKMFSRWKSGIGQLLAPDAHFEEKDETSERAEFPGGFWSMLPIPTTDTGQLLAPDAHFEEKDETSERAEFPGGFWSMLPIPATDTGQLLAPDAHFEEKDETSERVEFPGGFWSMLPIPATDTGLQSGSSTFSTPRKNVGLNQKPSFLSPSSSRLKAEPKVERLVLDAAKDLTQSMLSPPNVWEDNKNFNEQLRFWL